MLFSAAIPARQGRVMIIPSSSSTEGSIVATESLYLLKIPNNNKDETITAYPGIQYSIEDDTLTVPGGGGVLLLEYWSKCYAQHGISLHAFHYMPFITCLEEIKTTCPVSMGSSQLQIHRGHHTC